MYILYKNRIKNIYINHIFITTIIYKNISMVEPNKRGFFHNFQIEDSEPLKDSDLLLLENNTKYYTGFVN